MPQRGGEPVARTIRVDPRGTAVDNLVGLRLEGMPEFTKISEWSTQGDEPASLLWPSGHPWMGHGIDVRENRLWNRGWPASAPGAGDGAPGDRARHPHHIRFPSHRSAATLFSVLD